MHPPSYLRRVARLTRPVGPQADRFMDRGSGSCRYRGDRGEGVLAVLPETRGWHVARRIRRGLSPTRRAWSKPCLLSFDVQLCGGSGQNAAHVFVPTGAKSQPYAELSHFGEHLIPRHVTHQTILHPAAGVRFPAVRSGLVRPGLPVHGHVKQIIRTQGARVCAIERLPSDAVDGTVPPSRARALSGSIGGDAGVHRSSPATTPDALRSPRSR